MDACKFWSRATSGDGCWEWQGTRCRDGYGKLTWMSHQGRLAHRVAWELTHGPIRVGLRVLHRCDNPPCVRPDHLFLGTQADNVADRDAKGRQARGAKSGRRLHPERFPIGERHWDARTTADRVRSARILRGLKVRIADIARWLGISPQSANRMLAGKTWKHV